MTVRAIFEKEHGIFRPIGQVDLPDQAEVEFRTNSPDKLPPAPESTSSGANERIMEILARRYNTGQTDTAARHDEHQP